MAQALRDNQGYNEQEIVVERPDGSRRIALAHANPFFDESGQVAGAMNVLVDITERKQAEMALAAEQKVLRSIAAGTPLPQVLETLMRETETQSTDGMLCSVLLFDKTASKLRHGAAPSLPAAYNRAVDGLAIGPCAGSCGTAAFRRRPVFVTDIAANPLWADFKDQAAAHGLGACCSTPIFSSQGELLGTVAMYYRQPRNPRPHDQELIQRAAQLAAIVIERERAEEALRQSEERFRTLVTATSDVVYSMSPDWSAMRYLGGRDFLTDTQEPSRTWLEEYIPASDWPRVRAAIREAIRTKSVFELEHRIWRLDGSVAWTFSRAVPLLDADGEIVEWLGMSSDVSRRKLVEEALRKREEEFRTLADHIAQFAWMADGEGWIFWYNQRWFDYTGMTLEQMQGWGWQAVHHPDHVGRVVEKVSRHWKSGEVWEDTFPLRGKDGSYRWFLSRAVPIRDAAGNIVRWFGTNTDITEQRAAEEALKDADRRKDEFLATLAHELRNPLAPIRNGLQVMKLARINDAAIERSRAMMERQLEQLVRLVDDLLDVSRISRGKIELRTERIDLATVVGMALESCEPLIKQLGHELTVTLPTEPMYVDADKTRLAQALCNLLNNAAKYSDRGGHIWLTVARASGGCQPPDEAILSVKDSGVGIPAPMLAKVFDLFTQVDRSLEKSQGGLGIGLTIAKRLIEMHGGRIEAKSAGQGMGSEFLIHLPIAPSLNGQQPAERAGEPSSSPARRRILIVDDNTDAADSLAMLLRIRGNEVRTAHDGLEGVAAAAAFRPDVILLDIGMPKLNGYDACCRIRQEPWGREIVLVALTGWGQDEDKRLAQEAGFTAHLVKPVDPDALEKLLGQWQAARA